MKTETAKYVIVIARFIVELDLSYSLLNWTLLYSTQGNSGQNVKRMPFILRIAAGSVVCAC